MPIERPISSDSAKATVVIPTLPRRDHTRVVESLKKQTVMEYEVLAVNSDELDICEARNRGLTEANTDLVLFTDDDCQPPPDWVERAVRQFQNEELVLLEGPLDLHRPGPRHYVGANLAVDRDAAMEVGGFDSRFAGWRDDTEFGWRMEKHHGVDKCRYDSTWLMRHPGEFGSERRLPNELRFNMLYSRRVHSLITNPNSKFKQLYIEVRQRWYKVLGHIYKRFVYSSPKPLASA